MSDLVSELIFNALATGRGVNLPGIGVLEVVHRAARRRGRRLLPPREEVGLTLRQQFGLPSAIDLLEAQTHDRRHAEAVYGAWIEESGARRSGVVEIERVGTIRQGDFTIAPQLDGVLNPSSAAHPIGLKPRCGRRWWIWLLALLAAALIFAGWHYRAQVGAWTGQIGSAWSRIEWPDLPNFLRKQAHEPVLVDTMPIVTDSLSIDSLQVDSLAADNLSVVAQGEDAAWSAARGTQGARYHLIIGMYSSRRNAEDAVWRLARGDGRLECTIVVRGDRFLVSAYSSSSRPSAEARRRALSSRYPDVWVWAEGK